MLKLALKAAAALFFIVLPILHLINVQFAPLAMLRTIFAASETSRPASEMRSATLEMPDRTDEQVVKAQNACATADLRSMIVAPTSGRTVFQQLRADPEGPLTICATEFCKIDIAQFENLGDIYRDYCVDE